MFLIGIERSTRDWVDLFAVGQIEPFATDCNRPKAEFKSPLATCYERLKLTRRIGIPLGNSAGLAERFQDEKWQPSRFTPSRQKTHDIAQCLLATHRQKTAFGNTLGEPQAAPSQHEV